MDAEQKIEVCPFPTCAAECQLLGGVGVPGSPGEPWVVVACTNRTLCRYETTRCGSKAEAIAAHNAASRAVRLMPEAVELLRHALYTSDELNDRRLAVLLRLKGQEADNGN